MVDFKKYLKDGFKSAQIAATNRADIENVFMELNRQIGEETGGRLSIQIQERHRFPELAKSFLEQVDDFKKNYVLSAIIPGMEHVDIAKWHQASSGYPCRIVFDDMSLSCEDRKSLEKGLSKMLSNSIVGSKISTLLAKNPPLKISDDETP